MSAIIEIVPSIIPQMRSDTRVKTRANAIMFQNAGNVKVVLDEAWTLLPGEKLSMGDYNPEIVLRHTFNVRFVGGSMTEGEEPNPLLEAYELNVSGFSRLANYIDKP